MYYLHNEKVVIFKQILTKRKVKPVLTFLLCNFVNANFIIDHSLFGDETSDVIDVLDSAVVNVEYSERFKI